MLRIFFTSILVISLIACTKSKQEKKSLAPKLPSGISYSVLGTKVNNAISKATLEVRLNKEVTEDNLIIIANELRTKNSNYSKVYIFYYLPDMDPEGSAWAVSHFKPTLELSIVGASRQANSEMQKTKISGEILKVWEEKDPIAPNVKYLVKEGGKLYMKSIYAKTKYVDASEIIEELTESKQNGLIRYDYKNNHGEYYLVQNSGDLGLYNSEGQFSVAKKKVTDK